MFSKCKVKNNSFNKFKEGLPGSAFRNRKTTTGFSLVELMVSIGIFAIITSVVMFNYGRFESNMVVTNLAYEAALATRQAQVYGISVKKTKGGDFDSSYGVYFGADNQKFYLFADNNKDNLRAENESEDEEVFSMNGTNVINKFCVVSDNSGEPICNSSDTFSSLSIIFTRPEPNAHIYTFNNGGGLVGWTYSTAYIYVSSGRGDKVAKVTVTNTGQISVGKE